MKEKNRKEYFDYLNIFACLAVLFMHHNGLAHHFEYSVKWFVSLAIEVLCYWAVPCFFMMSGAKLMRYRQRQSTGEFLKKRFFKIAFPWIVWSLLFLLLQIIKGSVSLAEVNVRSVISWVLNSDIIEVYWFFPAIISVYLCIPVLAFIAEQKNGGRILIYMAALSFAFVSTLPYLSHYLGIVYNNDLIFPLGGGISSMLFWAIYVT